MLPTYLYLLNNIYGTRLRNVHEITDTREQVQSPTKQFPISLHRATTDYITRLLVYWVWVDGLMLIIIYESDRAERV